MRFSLPIFSMLLICLLAMLNGVQACEGLSRAQCNRNVMCTWWVLFLSFPIRKNSKIVRSIPLIRAHHPIEFLFSLIFTSFSMSGSMDRSVVVIARVVMETKRQCISHRDDGREREDPKRSTCIRIHQLTADNRSGRPANDHPATISDASPIFLSHPTHSFIRRHLKPILNTSKADSKFPRLFRQIFQLKNFFFEIKSFSWNPLSCSFRFS